MTTGIKVGKKLMSWGFEEPEDEFEWTDFCENLKTYLEKKSPDGFWHAEVKNFGWDSRCGQKEFKAEDGEEFLQKILPNCECKFNIHNYGRGLAIQNYHHDSPTGNEWYYLTPRKGDPNG